MAAAAELIERLASYGGYGFEAVPYGEGPGTAHMLPGLSPLPLSLREAFSEASPKVVVSWGPPCQVWRGAGGHRERGAPGSARSA